MGEIYKENTNLNKETGENTETKELYVGEIMQPPTNKILFRDNEIERVQNIMEKCENRSVLLVGDYGCGKRSIVEGFVDKVTREGIDYRVINFDFPSIIKSINNKKEFEESLKQIFDGIKIDESKSNILNINNLGHLVHYNCFENCGYMFLNELMNEMDEFGIRVIATTTNKEYSELESHLSKVLDYFTVIKLTEITKEQTMEILKNEIPFY